MSQQHPEQAVTHPNGHRRLKVLLSVYACEPHKSSEPGVGWNMVKQISRYHDVWVLTSTEHQPAIEKEIAANPVPNTTWVFQNVPRWLTFWKKGERGRRIHYYMWQVGAYFTAKKLKRTVDFDVIHHITYVSYWTPSFLSLLGVPFVWGPVGGAESVPRSFYPTLNQKAQRYEMIRDTIRGLAVRLDPFVAKTARNSAIALATTEETVAQMRELGATHIRIMPESALPPSEIEMLNNLAGRAAASPFRMISMGRLIGWKGFHLGIMAFAQLVKEVPDSEYWIVGDGVERAPLEQLARELGVADKIVFTGLIPRQDALNRLSRSDVLVHPSLHDSGGWVCIEAMAAGRPVVCLNVGGPGVQVTDETGFRVAVTTPEQTVREMAKALYTLATDRELRDRMGEAGKKRVWDDFNWDDKGLRITEIYQQVVKA